MTTFLFQMQNFFKKSVFTYIIYKKSTLTPKNVSADYKEYCFSNTCKATDIISYTNKLLYNDEVIVLLTLLNENILVVEQVLGIDYLVKSRKFLLVDRNATTLDKLAHLAL